MSPCQGSVSDTHTLRAAQNQKRPHIQYRPTLKQTTIEATETTLAEMLPHLTKQN